LATDAAAPACACPDAPCAADVCPVPIAVAAAVPTCGCSIPGAFFFTVASAFFVAFCAGLLSVPTFVSIGRMV